MLLNKHFDRNSVDIWLDPCVCNIAIVVSRL